ncbi:MAG: carbohydrate binding domain-containing protein, partial [Armatimonadota bacterium]
MTLSALLLLAGACFAQEDPMEIELTNPGFEDGLSGWSIVHPDFTSVDTDVARSGEASLRLSDETGASNAYVAQVARDLEGGATYRLSAWYRGEAAGERAQAAMKIEGYTAEGSNPLGKYVRERLTDTAGDWQQIVLEVELPPEIERASLLLRLFGPGTAWFDDVTFEQTAPAPVVTIGPERLAPEPGAREVTFTARLAEPWDETEPPIDIQFFEADDGEVASETALARVDDRIFEATVTLGEPLASGSYRVEASLDQTLGGMAWVHVPMADRKPANLTD